MRIIFIDAEQKCHPVDDGTMTPYETSFFDGKCDAFVEGFRIAPSNEGMMCVPWKPTSELYAYQTQYEAMLPEMNDMRNALNRLGVTVDG